MIVLDACGAVEIARQSLEGQALQWFMGKNEKIITCELYRAEVASVYRKFARSKAITLKEAEEGFEACIDLIDEFYALEGLQTEALRESVRLDHSTYDLFYFVLARRMGATLFTVDRKLMKLCEENGVSCLAEVELDTSGWIHSTDRETS